MGEEAGGYDFDFGGGDGGGYGGYDGRVMEWETGLPESDELTPLSQPLVPPGLAAAFSIRPKLVRTLMDVHRAFSASVSRLRSSTSGNDNSAGSYPSCPEKAAGDGKDNSTELAGVKRARLVWTPQLHKRFVNAVAHLGIKNAVPKTIMQLMSVDGLTRENVASHLHKYRLYLKRMQGLGHGVREPTPVPHSLREPTSVPHSLREPTPVPHSLRECQDSESLHLKTKEIDTSSEDFAGDLTKMYNCSKDFVGDLTEMSTFSEAFSDLTDIDTFSDDEPGERKINGPERHRPSLFNIQSQYS